MTVSAAVSATSGAGLSSRSGFARRCWTARGPLAGVELSSRVAAMESIGVMGVMLASDMADLLNPMLGVGIIFLDSCVVNDFFWIPDEASKNTRSTLCTAKPALWTTTPTNRTAGLHEPSARTMLDARAPRREPKGGSVDPLPAMGLF